ncbi:reverse transcriptase domain-containing protein, partial [Tanacetum coccineum]
CMNTRSSSSNLVPPFIDPESVIRARRRNLGDPSLLLDFEEINMNPHNVQGPPPAGPPPQNHNGPPEPNLHMPALDLRTMEELCQPTMNGRGGPIAPVNIQAINFGLKNHMIQQVQNSCQFHGLPGDDANKHLDKFLTITQSMKQNGVTDDALRLYLFPYSLMHHATAWGESSTTSFSSEIAALAQQMVEMRKDMLQMFRSNQQVNSVTPSCETCGGPHSYYECQAASDYTQDVYATTRNYNLHVSIHQIIKIKGALPSNTVPNLRKQINFITIRSGLTNAEPSIPPPVPPTLTEEVEQEPETLMDEVHITSPTSITHVPPLGIQLVSPPKPKEDPRHQPKIPYPLRLDKIKLLNKNDVQISKFLKILKQLYFDISLMDALTQILLKEKDKLEELANTLINVECYAILLNKVPEKLGDPRKFLIPCILQDLELANRSVALPKGIAQDVIVRVDKFNFLANFVVVDFEADPRVPIILGRPFLCNAKALVDLYEEKLTLRVGNEQVVFYTDKSSRNNLRDIQSVHCINIINFLKDKPISGSTIFSSDSLPGSSFPSSTLVETSDSLLEEFADEFALLDPFPPRNEDDNFDPEADLREIEYFRFTDEPALVYLSLLGDDDDDLFDLKSDNEEWKKLLYDMDDDLFYLKSDTDEWKKLLYGDHFNDIYSEKDKIKDSKMKILIDELESLESNVLLPQLLTSNSTHPEESSKSFEIATLLSSLFRNKDKVFNPCILILGGTQIFNDESKDKDFKVNTSSEALLILEERNFLSISSDEELFFHLELSVTETLLSFSSENEDKVFNPEIPISKGVHSFTLGLSHQTYETFKIVNVHPNIFNECPMKIFLFFCFCPKDKGIRGEIPYDRDDHRACFQSSNHSVFDHLDVYI